MQSIERAIRNALAKADAKNPEIRQRVYTSVWQVHERTLMQNVQIDEVQRNQRRQQLTQLIRSVEAEFATVNAALKSDTIMPSQVERDEQIGSLGSLGSINPARDYGAEGNPSGSVTEAEKTNKNSEKNKKTSHFLKFALILIIFILGLGFFYYNQIANAPLSSDGRANSALNSGLFKKGENPDDALWITIFTPQNAERISLKGSATAEIANIEGVNYLQIKSNSANDVIQFDIGEGILRQYMNKKATFNIIAGSSDGKPAQMSVTCNFGNMGDCQRRRYDVTGTRGDYLFDVQFSADKVVPKNGIISINTDLTGSGRAIDILAIRVEKPQ